MSHFSVGVIVQEPDDLCQALAPYGECSEEFYERMEYMSLEDYIYQYRTYHNNAENMTDADIIAQAMEEYDDVEDGIIYIHCNPRAHWDWWSVGGRWRYGLKVYKNAPQIKDQDLYREEPRKQRGKYRWVDGAKIKDIQWDKMNAPDPEAIKHWSRLWDVVVENHPLEEGEIPYHCYGAAYYRNKYGTKENFIKKQSLFSTFALLDDIENEWYEEGTMGWFGIDDVDNDGLDAYLEHFYNVIKNPEYQDYWFIVVDCHI